MQFLNNVRTQDASAPVTLVVNEETYSVSPDNYRGKTVAQLFSQYGENLGVDPARINRYVINNEIVPGETTVRPGETVRGAVTSENKGF
jgi:hypothetical protein